MRLLQGIKCMFGHKYEKSLELTPMKQSEENPCIIITKYKETHVCQRCNKVKEKTEILPFNYIV